MMDAITMFEMASMLLLFSVSAGVAVGVFLAVVWGILVTADEIIERANSWRGR